jgi:flagellar biosynthetic protein FliR
MRFSEAELLAELARYLWPFLRIGALFVSIPIFSSHSVPVRVRTLTAMAVTAALAPALPPMPGIELFSLAGLLVGMQQLIVGLAFGFILNLAFAAIVFGGQNIAYNMGLGFASLIDPQTGVQVPVISQFYLILATLLFLQMDAHLVAIQLLADSFKLIPVDMAGLGRERLWAIAAWSGRLFSAGVLLSLPVVGVLLLINLGFGVASRSAPQLNIFSVGFPVSLLLGLLLVWAGLPNLMHQFGEFLDEAMRTIEKLMR